MGNPLLQAEIEIPAPASVVWELISNLKNMPRWSPQCRWMKPLGPVQVGTRTINFNRRGLIVWPTTSVITEFIPQKKIAFRINENKTVWSYELTPIPEGTRLVETRSDGEKLSKFSSFVTTTALGGVSAFEQELLQGMHESLQRIKQAACS